MQQKIETIEDFWVAANALTILLVNLPDTEDGIAKLLAAEECQGMCGSAINCPFARYIRKKIPAIAASGAIDTINMRQSRVLFHQRLTKGDLPMATQAFSTPAALYDFIAAFDSHRYPHLELPTAQESILRLI